MKPADLFRLELEGTWQYDVKTDTVTFKGGGISIRCRPYGLVLSMEGVEQPSKTGQPED